MSAFTAPITPEAFIAAIRDLELEQLHTESARLHNSIYHLRRSNNALEEFRDDEDCRAAIEENVATIERQEQRAQLIKVEVERRGFMMPCGEGRGREGSGESAAAVNGISPGDSDITTAQEVGGSRPTNHDEEEEEGVYL